MAIITSNSLLWRSLELFAKRNSKIICFGPKREFTSLQDIELVIKILKWLGQDLSCMKRRSVFGSKSDTNIMLPAVISERLQELNIPEGLAIFLIILIIAHILIVIGLCINTKRKAAKWKRQRKLRKED